VTVDRKGILRPTLKRNGVFSTVLFSAGTYAPAREGARIV